MTVLDLIKGSLRLCGSLGIGRGIGASAEADCLLTLNAMLASWNTERLTVYTTVEATYPLVANQATYTIGPSGADFTAARPNRIDRAAIVLEAYRLPIEVLTEQRWSWILERANQAPMPVAIYSDGGSPLSTLHLWPIPTTASGLVLTTWGALTAFGAVTDTIALPDGYERALMYNLALELAPQFPDSRLTPIVVETARQAKAAIKRLNAPVLELVMDPALANRWGNGSEVRESGSAPGTPGPAGPAGPAGPPGSSGGGSGALFAAGEVPSGTINGSNTTFGLAAAPSPALGLILTLNGLVQQQGVDYTLSSATITFATAPATSSILIAWYWY